MTAQEKVFSWIEENKDDLFGLLRSLIQIDTQNQGEPDTCDESEASRFVADYFRNNGWETDMYAFDKDSRRFNVVGNMKGTGGGKDVMFNGHLDTVPIGDESLWTHEPLGGEISDGKIWGRGASDCKSGVAGMIFAAKAIQECGIRLKGDVLIVPSV